MQTTIKLRQETKKRLDKLREHPNESYDQVLNKTLHILEQTREEPKLSQKAIKEIEAARKRMEKGEYYTLEEVKKRLGLE